MDIEDSTYEELAEYKQALSEISHQADGDDDVLEPFEDREWVKRMFKRAEESRQYWDDMEQRLAD